MVDSRSKAIISGLLRKLNSGGNGDGVTVNDEVVVQPPSSTVNESVVLIARESRQIKFLLVVVIFLFCMVLCK